MVNYQNGKIYKLVNDNMPDMVYYGSTTQSLSKRLWTHKDRTKKNVNLCYSKYLFESGKVQIILVEKCPCDNKEHLIKRERYYIENNDCVNKYIPGRTSKEYYLDNIEKRKIYNEKNKEHIAKINKEYREKNKQNLDKRCKKKVKCECGRIVAFGDLARHKKSLIHNKLTN